jgi:hypothetical protein
MNVYKPEATGDDFLIYEYDNLINAFDQILTEMKVS